MRALGDEVKEEYWREFLWRLQRYQFLLLTVPLSSDNPVVYPQESYGILEAGLSRCNLVYPDFADGARDLLRRFAAIASQRANPLMQAIVEICTTGEPMRTALVLKETRFIACVEEVLSKEAPGLPVRVVGTQHLRGETCYDRLIVLGALRWYPEYVSSAPRAQNIHVVSCIWVKDEWKLEPAFVASQSTSSHASASSGTTIDEAKTGVFPIAIEPASPEELLPAVDWDRISQGSSLRATDILEQEEIEARLFLLESGAAVFVDAAETAKALVIDLDEDLGEEEGRHKTSRVKRIPASLVEPGMFVLLRTSGGGDYLIPLADKILGARATEIRARQEDWKGRLRAKVREKGLFATSIDLLDRGSGRAEESNVRNWASSRNIRPHDKSDFVAILRLVGLEDKVEEYWKNAKMINSAHMKAGFYIRKLLLRKVAGADLGELERTGKMEFELQESGAGGLTAYRIIALSLKQYLVPVSHIGRSFESYEDLWQE